MMSLFTKSSVIFVLALVPVAEVDGQSSGRVCTSPPCAASLTGDVALTTVSGVGSDGTTFASGENVYGAFENGFGQSDDAELTRLCGNPNVETSELYVGAGIDAYTVGQMIAAKCDTELPRVVGGELFGILDTCGAKHEGEGEYHFAESMSCLYSNAAAGHSPEVAEVLAETNGVRQKLFGKWENYNPTTSTYILPALDTCNGHFGVTPDSNGEVVYHYHTTDLPPYTVGCFGPAKDASNQDILVSPTTCRGLYTGSNGCGGDDIIRVNTPSGSRNYDPWCPCWSGLSNVEGGEAPSMPPSPPRLPSPPPAPPPPSTPLATIPLPPPPSASPSPLPLTTHTIAINAGWTWISSPLMEGAINDVVGDLGGIAAMPDDTLKNQFLFTTYIPGYGWFGGLETLNPFECYKVRVATGGNFVLSGDASDLTGRQVALNAGWTWLGWPSIESAAVNEAFTPALSDPTKLNSMDERIKSQFVFTSYIPGYGWFGDLENFAPGHGYMIKLSQQNTLTNFGLIGVSAPISASSVSARSGRKLEDARPHVMFGSSKINPSAFESSMCLVAVVVLDGIIAEDGHLAAFVNGELRGVAQPSSYKAPVGSYKGRREYNLMAYGQVETEGATITFQYRHPDGRVSALTTTAPFTKDAFLGSVQDPFVVDFISTVANRTTPTAPAVQADATPASIPSLTDVASPPSTSLSIGAIAGIAASGTIAILLLAALCVRRTMIGAAVDEKASSTSPATVVPAEVVVDQLSSA